MTNSWVEYYKRGYEREYKDLSYAPRVLERIPKCEELEKEYLGKRMTIYEMNDKLYPMVVLYTDCIDLGDGMSMGGKIVAIMPYKSDRVLESKIVEMYGNYGKWPTWA